MAKALFVFDHKFPVDKEGRHFYSSGFDEEFFNRYYKIFDSFDIFGRVSNINNSSNCKQVEYPSVFYLESSNKRILSTRIKKRMMDAIDSVDCVIARMPSLFGALAIKLSRDKKKPYIVEIVACTYDALSNSPSFIRRVLARPAEFYYRNVLKNNPYNIYVTKYFLQNKYPCIGKQIACSNVTLPYVEDEVLNNRLIKLRQFNTDKKIVIGTTSTLNVDFKGQKYVIQALPALLKLGYNIEYQLVGDGDATWLIDIAKALGVQKNVKVIGRLNHEDVFLWLDQIDIYVHPSCQEGLSRAIIEAMSRACPIVAADAGGVHELIDIDFIVPIKSPEMIVKGIDRIIKSNLYDQAICNFEKSKEYTISVLYKRRETFFRLFMEENGLI